MYEIRRDGGVIALAEMPNYIRRHADGFYILCEEEEAQGVAVDGTVYRLMGRTGLDELEEVQLIERDTGAVLQSSSEAVSIAFVTMTEKGDIDGVTAGEHAELFSQWEYPVAYTAGQIRERNGKLYKCLQAHTSQEGWNPAATPALWVVVDVEHAGTQDDPIPASRGMEYEYGKYYLDSEDGKTYLCERTGEAAGGKIVLQYLPHELVGNYFTAV